MSAKRTAEIRKLNPEEQKVSTWIKENRGILTRIAVELHCCHQYVQQVAYGKSSTYKAHRPVEAALYREGWPGITRLKDRDLRIRK